MTTQTEEEAAPAEPAKAKVRKRPTLAVQLIGRFIFIWVCTILAFWSSLKVLWEQAVGGGLVGYVFVIPPLGWLAMQGVARRRRSEPPIHDRQTDLIVGFMGLVLSLLIQSVLLRRYVEQYELLRLDLLAMWMFIISASIMVYGLRPVARFRWVWLLMLAACPLPYHIMVVALGGGRPAAGVVMLPLVAIATALAVGRTRKRGLTGAALSVVVGGAVIAFIAIVWPSAPLFVYQAVPPIAATALVNISFFVRRRQRDSAARLIPYMPPLSATDVWAGAAAVLAVAIAISFISIPTLTVKSFGNANTTTFDRPLNIPADWAASTPREYPFTKRLFGPDATLFRQRITQMTGDLKWDKMSRPRVVVVDSVTTTRPNSFAVFRNGVLYDLSATRTSGLVPVDLGHGTVGTLYSVVDDKRLLTWTAITWTGANAGRAQRITIISVDNHDNDATFPEPAEALVSNLNTLFTILFRGNSAVADQNPTFKDADLLTSLARELVTVQLASNGPG